MIFMPWYVVAEHPDFDGADDVNIWTVSQDPDRAGWDTDSSYPRYGLPRSAAQFLVDAANEKEQRDGAAFPVFKY
jgi:hypothetical protein